MGILGDIRNFAAALIALALLIGAIVLGGTLHVYRRRRQQVRRDAALAGRSIVAELPLGADLTLFSEDAARFYLGERPIEKSQVVAVRLMVNGAVMSEARSPRASAVPEPPRIRRGGDDEAFVRDRWDVAIHTSGDTVVVECGAIRERVSQELATRIYDAVKRVLG